MKKYSFPVRVYFYDTDAEGIVYFGRYLDFAEHARTEMLREIFGGQGEMMKRSGICFVIKSVKAEYNRPAYLDDLLTVETTLLEMKRFSFCRRRLQRRPPPRRPSTVPSTPYQRWRPAP